ncbi:MAG TPA: GspE/PulE family protein [Usitatibacteraceae bacterium]|nr:GspE/PulE family protein [Usitatibacteraceae bacterium]
MPLDQISSSAAITAADIAAARAESAQTGQPMIDVLERQSGLSGDDFVAALGRALAFPAVRMDELREGDAAFDVVPFPEAVERGCVPIRRNGALALVHGDPFRAGTRAWMEERVGVPFSWLLAHPSTIAAFFRRFEESARAMDDVVQYATDPEEGGAQRGATLSLQSIGEDESLAVRLVNSTLYDALKSGASDIHLETDPGGLSVKYRVDGVLSAVAKPRGIDFAEQVISRVKVMAELDIAERRVPQDGRFRIVSQGRAVDLRVSVMPSIHGEDAVLRILDKQSLADEIRGLRLDRLGFDPDIVNATLALASLPYGMLLVTGPTGSGKTTTLYAAVTEINTGQDKIVTIEDPVEYQLPGVLQIPVNEKKGLTFARGLRSILRHDPDKILVGEIRDPDTAQIAVQAALTGHLVLTTIHANSAFDVIGRVGNMGVDAFSFASATNGILAQRLVRVTCEHCAEPQTHPEELLRASGIDPADAGRYLFRAGRGCGHCRGSGFRGRRAIAELLHLDEEIRELIARRESIRAIRQAARANGTRMLRESALDLVLRGETTLQEINRVTAVA